MGADLNSQFFANVYLNGLDQFVKHALKCRHYLRYCDDFVLLSDNREQLLEWRERIEIYLRETLRLELNPKQRLRRVSEGVDFLGYIVRADYLLVRRRAVNNLRERLRAFEAGLVLQRREYRRYRFDEEVLDKLAACLASYLGHFKQANTFRLRRALWRQYPFLAQYFEFDAEHSRLVRKYKTPLGLRRSIQQYRYFRWRFQGDVLFFQVGRFIEFYHPADAAIAYRLELAAMAHNRRGALWGFPLEQAGRHLRRLLRAGFAVTCIAETGRCLTGIQERVPVGRFVPIDAGATPSA